MSYWKMVILILLAIVTKADVNLYLDYEQWRNDIIGKEHTIDFSFLPDGAPSVNGYNLDQTKNYDNYGINFHGYSTNSLQIKENNEEWWLLSYGIDGHAPGVIHSKFKSVIDAAGVIVPTGSRVDFLDTSENVFYSYYTGQETFVGINIVNDECKIKEIVCYIPGSDISKIKEVHWVIPIVNNISKLLYGGAGIICLAGAYALTRIKKCRVT